MIRKRWVVGGAAVLAVAWACGDTTAPAPVPVEAPAAPEEAVTPPPPGGGGSGTEVNVPPEHAEESSPPPEVGTPTPTESGSPDPSPAPTPPPDPGPAIPPPPPQPLSDPWPKDAAVNFSQRFSTGRPQSVAVDDAFNIWLLERNRIGVLRPGATEPVWAENIGQAGRGFASTVMCGGSAGRVYVGYAARELDQPERTSYKDPTFLEGDLDVVQLRADGTIALEEHMYRSYRLRKEANDGSMTWYPPNAGIQNSNSWRYDEDRSVLSCVKVMRGRDRGEVYIGTNHGVTRIRGLHYNSHRHPVYWDANGSQRAGYTYAVGIAQDGDVLIGNDWTFGIVTPNAELGVWDWMSPKSLNPMKVESSYLPEVNSLEEFDRWRGFQQTKDGRYYMASRDLGLWQMSIVSHGNREQKGTKVAGLPTDALTSLAATDDGSLFIGTTGSGLWRLDAQKKLTPVEGVAGKTVKQLIYDPNGTPAMLYVLTDAGLTVLRGF